MSAKPTKRPVTGKVAGRKRGPVTLKRVPRTDLMDDRFGKMSGKPFPGARFKVMRWFLKYPNKFRYGIWDEQRSGWLYEDAGNPDRPRQVFYEAEDALEYLETTTTEDAEYMLEMANRKLDREDTE